MGWGWYTCPMYDGCPYTRECQPLMWQEEASFCGGLMTIHVGSSLCRRVHQPWFVVPPPKSLLPTYPWSSSFPSRHLPSLVTGHQVSNSLHLFFCCSTIFVGVLLQWIGPVPPRGCSSIYLSQKLCTHPHSLVGASLLPMVGKMKLTESLGHHLNIKQCGLYPVTADWVAL